MTPVSLRAPTMMKSETKNMIVGHSISVDHLVPIDGDHGAKDRRSQGYDRSGRVRIWWTTKPATTSTIAAEALIMSPCPL